MVPSATIITCMEYCTIKCKNWLPILYNYEIFAHSVLIIFKYTENKRDIQFF